MVKILDRTKILDETVSRDLLVESAQNRWHLPAASTWSVELLSKEENSGKYKPVQRQWPLPRKALIMKERMKITCASCYLSHLNKMGVEIYLCGYCQKRVIFSTALLPMPIWSQDRAKKRLALPWGPISELRCRKCDNILPEGNIDRLCELCALLDIGCPDQESAGWLYPGYSGDLTDVSEFESSPLPTYKNGFSGNTSGGLFNSIHNVSDRVSSDSVVEQIQEVAIGEEPPAPKSPLSLDYFGLEEELPMTQNMPACKHIIDHTQQSKSSIGYLV